MHQLLQCCTNVLFNRNLSYLPRTVSSLASPSTIAQHPTVITEKFAKDTTRPQATMHTDILPIDPTKLGRVVVHNSPESTLDNWDLEWQDNSKDVSHISRAASELTTTDTPVAFPTETVYGLGADATRSSAVRAIFQAKQRPADNPLIVHVHSIQQLRELLNGDSENDPIPKIYKPLIRKFWPGPLTIIVPNPKDSALAPEVTCGLGTFGVRIPRSLLALALLKLAGVPVAAPSANASTRPSPTAAEHVKDDLDGRIQIIIDGGPCEVGVESTVVDGLSHPPTILRPGGITTEQLRQCEGWENVVMGYKDVPEKGIKPRAPGMKYRHYSPKAPVILFEASAQQLTSQEIVERAKERKSIGIIRTGKWSFRIEATVEEDVDGVIGVIARDPFEMSKNDESVAPSLAITQNGKSSTLEQRDNLEPAIDNLLLSIKQHRIPHAREFELDRPKGDKIQIWDIQLGCKTTPEDSINDIARGLFSALRELDKKDVDCIFVEGVDDSQGNIASAVMNRLRKAAEIRV